MDMAEPKTNRRTKSLSGSQVENKTQKFLLISSPKGGSGKTTLARNLAVAAALSNFKVATVDLDRQQSLSRWWGKRPEGFAFVQHYTADIGDTNEILQQITEFDLLIVDTPPAIEEHPEQIQILVRAADLVLIPSQPSDDDTESVIPWMDFVVRSGKPAAFILNRIRRNTHSLRAAKLMLLRAGRLCPMEIPHTEDMSRSRSLGLGILEIRNGQGADEVDGVWAFVRAELGL